MLQKKNERFHQQNIYQYGQKRSIMIWAAISAVGKSELIRFNGNVRARRYMAEALQPALVPFLNRHNQHHLCTTMHPGIAHTQPEADWQHKHTYFWPLTFKTAGYESD